MQQTSLGPYQLFGLSLCMVHVPFPSQWCSLKKVQLLVFVFNLNKNQDGNTLWSSHPLPISLIHPRRVVGSLSKVWVRTRQWPLYRTILHVSCSLSVTGWLWSPFPRWGCGWGVPEVLGEGSVWGSSRSLFSNLPFKVEIAARGWSSRVYHLT